MTGLSISIMRLKHSRTILNVSILMVTLLTWSVDSEDCEPQIFIHRKTVYKAFMGGTLSIECPFILCNNLSSVTWKNMENTTAADINDTGHKSIEIKLKNGSNLSGTSTLSFKTIQRRDEGMYRCEVGSVVSHLIQVSVADPLNDNVPNDTYRNHTKQTPQWGQTELYVYTTAAIAGFVILVIILSIISMRGCKGKAKRKTEEENQYMAIPVSEQPLQSAHLPPSPRRTPPVPTSRQSVRKQKSPGEPPREPRIVYGKVKRGNERLAETVEEKQNSIVYAAISHRLTPTTPTRPQRTREEISEYAAIRVC